MSQLSSEHGQSKQPTAVPGSTSVHSYNTTPIQTSTQSTQQGARVQSGDQQSSSDSIVVANTQSTQQNTQTNPQGKGNPLSLQPSQTPIPIRGDSGSPAQSKSPAVQTGNPAALSPPREQKPQSNPQTPPIKAVDKPVKNKDKAPQSIVHAHGKKSNTAKIQPEKQTGISKQHKSKSSQTQEPIDTNANFQKQLNPDPNANSDTPAVAAEEGVPNE